jgi:accessory gene regulator protein AgrB
MNESRRLCSKTTWCLLAAFPIALLVLFFYHPARYETRVLFDLHNPERNGELISSSGYTLLDHIVASFVFVSAIGFAVGLVFLCVSFYRRHHDTAPTNSDAKVARVKNAKGEL